MADIELTMALSRAQARLERLLERATRNRDALTLTSIAWAKHDAAVRAYEDAIAIIQDEKDGYKL
jgi:hypothetical protein